MNYSLECAQTVLSNIGAVTDAYSVLEDLDNKLVETILVILKEYIDEEVDNWWTYESKDGLLFAPDDWPHDPDEDYFAWYEFAFWGESNWWIWHLIQKDNRGLGFELCFNTRNIRLPRRRNNQVRPRERSRYLRDRITEFWEANQDNLRFFRNVDDKLVVPFEGISLENLCLWYRQNNGWNCEGLREVVIQAFENLRQDHELITRELIGNLLFR